LLKRMKLLVCFESSGITKNLNQRWRDDCRGEGRCGR
jgi:hypothetical protein